MPAASSLPSTNLAIGKKSKEVMYQSAVRVIVIVT